MKKNNKAFLLFQIYSYPSVDKKFNELIISYLKPQEKVFVFRIKTLL